MHFFLLILTSGLLAGVMYAMVAIGFVLIYKASGVFNFAQGSLVFLAALTFVTLLEHGIPFWLAFLATALLMIISAVLIERLVLRPLVDRSPLTLFMATLGLSYVIEGIAQVATGTDVHQLDLGVEDLPTHVLGLEISQLDLFASGVAVLLVVVLAVLFDRTRIGTSLRAVADDTLAAQSIGIRLPAIWRIVWSVSGFVALVAGLLWGARQGVQYLWSR
jgi:branched-chain amino acid transport system permease protein